MSLLSYIPRTKAWRKRRSTVICQQAHERMQEIVDGEVPIGKAKQVLELHLEHCPPCAVEAETLRKLKEAIGRVGAETDQECLGKLDALAKRLRTEGE